jgi:hypothetical protein
MPIAFFRQGFDGIIIQTQMPSRRNSLSRNCKYDVDKTKRKDYLPYLLELSGRG